ncbi:MAG TPA: hypothetical protein VFS52_09105 [Steroidobacteraceae bacterium]|jgi:hypothetical protein|nr:hypothetical protein [Steroidobacteraceae bacterium]
MARVAPVLLFSTALSLMASAYTTKTEAQTPSGVPDYFFSTWTVNRDCTEVHAGTGGHTIPGSQFRVVRSPSADGVSYTLQTLDRPGREWSKGWRNLKLEYRAGTPLKSIPADFECVPGEEASQPFLAQSGFAVSGEPYYPQEHWYSTVTIHGQKHHLLIFPRNVKGADSAVILLIDADAGGNLQLDTDGTIISEN